MYSFSFSIYSLDYFDVIALLIINILNQHKLQMTFLMTFYQDYILKFLLGLVGISTLQ